MKVNMPEGQTKTFDTDKEYLYKKTFKHNGVDKQEEFHLKPELRIYEDGEGYGTDKHFGYVFIITKIISMHYNRRVGEVFNTVPDLINQVEEIK